LSIDWSTIHLPFLADEDIRLKADEFRRRYWGDDIPVDIELIVERHLNLLIIPVPDLLYEAHTEAFLSGDLREIVFDPARPDPRIRFSIAHEVGHYVLHRDVIVKLRPSSYRDWKQMQAQLPDAIWGRAEYQAREFAGRLLVPPDKLKEEIRELQPLIQEARRVVPDLEIQVIKELVRPKLARRFFVSEDVIGRRLDAEQISPVQE